MVQQSRYNIGWLNLDLKQNGFYLKIMIQYTKLQYGKDMKGIKGKKDMKARKDMKDRKGRICYGFKSQIDCIYCISMYYVYMFICVAISVGKKGQPLV